MCAYSYVLFLLLINTLLVSLLSVSLWKLIFCKVVRARALSWPLVPGGLVVRIQHSALTVTTWLQSLTRNWTPASRCCRPRPLAITSLWNDFEKKFGETRNNFFAVSSPPLAVLWPISSLSSLENVQLSGDKASLDAVEPENHWCSHLYFSSFFSSFSSIYIFLTTLPLSSKHNLIF